MSTQTANQTTSEPISPKQPRLRLEFLDGIRAFAALYVVANHASLMSMKLIGDGSAVPPLLRKVMHVSHFFVFNYGVYAVDVFIVLSGFCLMLPVARSADFTLEGGFAGFMQRRAWRIMPPYYAALVICLLFYAVAPRIGIDTLATSWVDLVMPVFSPGSIVSHLLLLHAWTPWRFTIDPPMWSVSTEWCIYFFFPLLLLPVFRRWGSWAAVLAAFALGLAPHYLGAAYLDKAYPWFLGLFALGMIGAVVGFSTKSREQSLFNRAPWGVAAAALLGVVVILTSLQRASLQHVAKVHWLRQETWGSHWPFDVVVGLATVCLILYCTKRVSGGASLPMLVRVFGSPAAVAVGAFSYSLYLIHAPVLELYWLWLKKSTLSPTASVLLFTLLSAPLSILVAYLFHLAFERRFLRSRRPVRKTVLTADERTNAPLAEAATSG